LAAFQKEQGRERDDGATSGDGKLNRSGRGGCQGQTDDFGGAAFAARA